MEEVSPTEEELKRRILFVPCNTKARLSKWIQVFLALEIPDSVVDEESTCSPMGMIWEIYDHCLNNQDKAFKQALYYASRDSFKTLSAAILEVLSIVHLKRSVAHMAAIEAQSKKSQQYVKKFLRRPYLRDFVVGDNERESIVVRYENRETKENLTADQFKSLPRDEQGHYDEISNYIKIIVCTQQGAHSEHVPLMCIDEVDVVSNPIAYQDAKMIPAPLDGMLPVTLLTSTRKFAFGLVQKEIDEAPESGLRIRHWNVIDVTEACPVERHRPDLPRLNVYRSDKTLRTMSEEQYDSLTLDVKEKGEYVREEAHAGCLQNCKLYAMCKGRLSTHQLSKSRLLKPIDHIQGLFRVVSLPTALAQLLSRKPSAEGLIYPGFDHEVHMLTAGQIAHRITGDDYGEGFTKLQLIQLLILRQVRFTAGMDFGYSHNFAVTCGPVDGNRQFIIEVIEMPELEPSQQLQICEDRIRRYNPEIFPDTENPQLVKVFKKAGWRMRDWKKSPGSVQGGIDIVRMKMRPALGDPQLFLLKDDDGCELLARRIAQYHWKLQPDGTLSNIPDEADDDSVDSLRYQVMNVFAVKGKVQASDDARRSGIYVGESQYTKENWFQKVVQEHAGPQGENPAENKGKAGGFKWDLG